MLWFPSESHEIQIVTMMPEEKILQVSEHHISLDDDICMMKCKLLHYVFKDKYSDVYIYTRHQTTEALIILFLVNLFRNRPFITLSEFVTSFYNVFHVTVTIDKKQYRDDNVLTFGLAKDIVTKNKPKYVYTPVGHVFKTVKGEDEYTWPVVYDPSRLDIIESKNIINENHKLVRSFKSDKFWVVPRIDNNIDQKIIQTYFPLTEILRKNRLAKDNVVNSVKNVNTILGHSMNASKDIESTTYPSYIHLRYHVEWPDIYAIFSSLNTTGNVPFIKCIHNSRTICKYHRPSFANGKITRKNLVTWSKQVDVQKYKVTRSLLVLKILLKSGKFATVILNSNGATDVKFVQKVNETRVSFNGFLRDFEATIDIMWTLLKDVVENLPPKAHFEYKDAEIVNVILMGSLHNYKEEKGDFIASLQSPILSDFMSVLSHANDITHVLYKRVNDFYSDENINNFVIRNTRLGEAAIVDHLVTLFNMTTSEGKAKFKEFSGTGNKGASVFFKHRNINVISIKIFKNGMGGYRFSIDGVTHPTEEAVILKCLTYAMNNALTTSTKKKNAVEAKPIIFNFDNDQFDFGDDDDDDDVDIDGDGDDNDEGDEENGIVLTIRDMKSNMKCPTDEKAKKQMGGINDILSKLHKADPTLFMKTSSATKNYAKSCQAVSRRQPIVMSDVDVAYNKKCFPGALPNIGKFGSSEALYEKNNYSCPSIWCPLSKVALTVEQYKRLGNKCPFKNLAETAYEYSSVPYWKEKDGSIKVGYVQPLASNKHPNNMSMPCCFKKDKKDDAATTSQNNNNKYIKTDSFPTEQARYGLLPEQLGNLFQNKFCGGADGLQGLMGKKTNCYLKYGMEPSKQSFIQAVKSSMNKTMDEGAFIKKLASLTMSDFLLLNKGDIYQMFTTLVEKNNRDVIEFKQWFENANGDPNVASYKKQFNLAHLDTAIPLWTLDAKDFAEENAIYREYITYCAFKEFRNYTMNDDVIKTHHMYIDLVGKQLDTNIIVFEVDKLTFKVTFPCVTIPSKRFDISKPFLLIVKSGPYYEPIHHVKYQQLDHKNKDKESIVIVKNHEYKKIQYIIDNLQKSCDRDKANDDLKEKELETLFKKDIRYIVLNYDQSLYGVYTKSHVLVPYFGPGQKMGEFIHMISHRTQGGVSFIYVDHLLKEHKEKLTKDDVLKELGGMGIKDGDIEIMLDNRLMKIKSHIVPLGRLPATFWKQADFDVIDDVKIFVQQVQDDKRTIFIDKTKNTDLLFKSFIKHLIHILDIDEINFLRHKYNPMSKNFKRSYLRDIILKVIDSFVYKAGDATNRQSRVAHDNMCMSFSESQKCMEPCKWIVKPSSDDGGGLRGMCKLRVHESLLDTFIERAIENILNPLFKLKQPKFIYDNVGDDTVIFTSDENNWDTIKDPQYFNYDVREKEVNISSSQTNSDTNNANNVVSHIQYTTPIDFPVIWRPVLTEYTPYLQSDQKWLFRMFQVQNEIAKNDVQALFKLISVQHNIVVIGTAKAFPPNGVQIIKKTGPNSSNSASTTLFLLFKNIFHPIILLNKFNIKSGPIFDSNVVLNLVAKKAEKKADKKEKAEKKAKAKKNNSA